MKICLYLEFAHFRGGALFKNIGTGLLSSYKNQKKMLEVMGVSYTEQWDDSCDILQINTPWIKSLYLMRRARKLDKPIIVWAHVTAEDIRGVFWFGNLISPFMRWYLGHAYNQADIILCPSEYTCKLVIAYGIDARKVRAQSNGVDVRQFYKDQTTREEGRRELSITGTAVGTVALAIPRKGIDTFLFLARELPSLAFLWVGKIYSGVLVKPLPKNLPVNARFTGYVRDQIAAFNAFDIFLFASYEENQGMAILEAAAIGLPIVVRDIPVYEGWLKHGENCLKAKDDKEFESHIRNLVADPLLRAKLGNNALTLAQDNSLGTLGVSMKEIYEKLLTK